MTTFDTLRQLLVDDYKLAPEAVAPETRLDALGVDSLGLLELLFSAEERFGIKIPTDRAELETVADVVRFIDRLVAQQHAAPQPARPAEPGA